MVSSSSWLSGCKRRSQRAELMLYPIYPLTTLVAAFPLNDARWWNNAVVDKLGLNAKISASLVSCKKCLEGISVTIGMRTVLVGACNLVFSSPQKKRWHRDVMRLNEC